MTEKPKRGRPKGSGKDDEPHLFQVARLLIEDEKLKPTTAMYRVIRQGKWPETDTTLIRRWQVKWKDGSERFLEAARQERAARLAAQERRSQREYRGAGGMADYVRAAMPQGYKFPPGLVNELAFMHSPVRANLRHLTELMKTDKTIADMMRGINPLGVTGEQYQEAMKIMREQDNIAKIYKDVDRVIALQKLMKF